MLSPCLKTCRLEGEMCQSCGRMVKEIMNWKDRPESEKKALMTYVFPLRLKINEIAFDDLNLLGRRLGPKDQDLILEHFLDLNPKDRRSRFGYSLEEESLRKWVGEIDWNTALVWGVDSDEKGSSVQSSKMLAAVGILSADSIPTQWEVGLSVLIHARQKGLGKKLLSTALKMAQYLTPHSSMKVYTQSDCLPIFKLVRSHGGKIQTLHGETIGVFEW